MFWVLHTSKIHTSQFKIDWNQLFCSVMPPGGRKKNQMAHASPYAGNPYFCTAVFIYCSNRERDGGGEGDSLCPCYPNVYLVSLFLTKGSAKARGLGTHPSQLLTWARTNASWSVKYRLLCDLWPVDSHFLLPPLSTLHSTDFWPSVTPITISVKTRSTI